MTKDEAIRAARVGEKVFIPKQSVGGQIAMVSVVYPGERIWIHVLDRNGNAMYGAPVEDVEIQTT